MDLFFSYLIMFSSFPYCIAKSLFLCWNTRDEGRVCRLIFYYNNKLSWRWDLIGKKAIKQKRINVRRLLGILGSYLVSFLLPFLSVSWIWYITTTESTEQQVRLMAKNQMMQINYSLESNFLKLAHLTERSLTIANSL